MPFDRSILNLWGTRLFCTFTKLPEYKVNNGDPDQNPRSASDLGLDWLDSFWPGLGSPSREGQSSHTKFQPM